MTSTYIFLEGVRRYHQTLKGVHGTKKVKYPGLEGFGCQRVLIQCIRS